MAGLPPIVPETPADAAEVDALITAAFGPGRLVKTAERLREGNHPILDLSAVARLDGKVVGCSRIWPVKAAGKPAVLLGPFAVADECRSAGLGAAMIDWCCERAKAAGWDVVLLVGDVPYFGRLGFELAPAVHLPGPVNPKRVLAKALTPGALEGLEGEVTV